MNGRVFTATAGVILFLGLIHGPGAAWTASAQAVSEPKAFGEKREVYRLRPQVAPADVPDERAFEFIYEARVTDVPEGAQRVELWAPVAQSDEWQTVELDETSVPEGAEIGTESRFGNRVLYVTWEAPLPERMAIDLRYRVTRREVVNEARWSEMETTRSEPSEEERVFLGPDSLVPLDGALRGVAEELGLEEMSPLEAAKRTYIHTLGWLTYDKSTPGWGRGDVEWACGSRSGNCSDFHSVFIGLNRIAGLPSYFEIGFPLPAEYTGDEAEQAERTRASGAGKTTAGDEAAIQVAPEADAWSEIDGYHCWAWVRAGEAGWLPVDISEADKHPGMTEYYFGALTPDRVAFSRGRDLTLVPPQAGEPLNFFIYPYVEVDGRRHEGVEKSFRFKDEQVRRMK